MESRFPGVAANCGIRDWTESEDAVVEVEAMEKRLSLRLLKQDERSLPVLAKRTY